MMAQKEISGSNAPVIIHRNVKPEFIPWINQAEERIYSLAAGNRMGRVAPKIMAVGYAKVLYAANEMGIDVEGSKSFVLFAPDGTCSLNIERTRRGFSYGGLLDMNFDGLMATSNSMPNGCGFSMYLIEESISDEKLIDHLKDAQKRLGEEELKQLGKGNHFAAIYKVKDPVSGEDLQSRMLVVHCSGHVGGDLLYFPKKWLHDREGYYEVQTPHGPIVMLEGQARIDYESQFRVTETANADNRDKTADEILESIEWSRLESITHQGLFTDTSQHLIGTQKHEGMMPIAFNPEEGLVAVRTKSNLTSEFMDRWDQGARARDQGLQHEFQRLFLTPHGGGYELRYPLEHLEINLGLHGIDNFSMKLSNGAHAMSFKNFREVRDLLTYRRKMEIMREVFRIDMATVLYDLEPLMQVYPVKSIHGGEL